MEAPGAAEQHELKMPLSIRLIGHVFLLTGLIVLGEMLMEYFFRRSTELNLMVLNVFVGSGLLLWSNVARHVAVFQLWIAAIGIPLLLVFGLALKVYWECGGAAPWQEGISIVTPTASDWRYASVGNCLLDVLLCVAILIAVIASFRTLEQDQTIKMFSNTARRPLQFGLSSFFFLVVTVGVLLVSLRTEIVYQDLEIVHDSLPSTTATAGTVSIAYGLRRHRWKESVADIEFVVIDHTASEAVDTWTSSSGGGKATLKGPDNQYLELPRDARLAEVDDERVLTFDGTVTEQQIEAYLDSNPPYPNIPDLLATPKSGAASP